MTLTKSDMGLAPEISRSFSLYQPVERLPGRPGTCVPRGHRLQDRLEGTLLEGLEDQVHRGPGEGAGEGVRHRHAPHPRGQGGSHAVGGVLEDDATGRWNAKATSRQEEKLRVGLDVCDVVAGDHDLDELPDAAAAQPALDPATGAARGHGPGEPEPSCVTEHRLDSREERLRIAHPGRGFPYLALKRLAWQRLPDEGFQVAVGIEPAMRAQGMLPHVEPEGLSAALVGAAPRLVDRCLGVDDQPVKIQDDGFYLQRFLVR